MLQADRLCNPSPAAERLRQTEGPPSSDLRLQAANIGERRREGPHQSRKLPGRWVVIHASTPRARQ